MLTAIRHGIPVASCGRRLKPNAEYGLKSPYAFARLFVDDPAAVARTLEVAERCRFSLDEIHYRYPSERLPDGTTSAQQPAYNRKERTGVMVKRSRAILFIPERAGGYREPRRIRAIFDDVGDRRVLPRQRHPPPGARLSGKFRRLLLPGRAAVDPVRIGLLFERFISKSAPSRRISISISSITGAKK